MSADFTPYDDIDPEWAAMSSARPDLRSVPQSPQRPPLKVERVDAQEVEFGDNISIDLVSAGGVEPYVWSLTGGELPEGVELDPDGFVEGIPTQAGEFKATLVVTDGDGVSRQVVVRVVVNPRRHVDLSWLLTGQRPVKPPTKFLLRTDGVALFYPGKVNILYGDPETTKTLLAQCGAAEALGAGHRVALLDIDHNGAEELVEFMLRLGVQPAVLADPDRFRICAPEDARDLLGTIEVLRAWGVEYTVVDSVGELVPMMGMKSNENDDVTTVLRKTLQVLATAGACVVAIDHLPKPQEGARRTEFSIGGMAKKRACNGSMLLMEVIKQPAPGAVGEVRVTNTKDRIGSLRRACVDQKRVGVFVIDSTVDDVTTWRVVPEQAEVPAADGGKRDTVMMEKVSRWLDSRSEPPPLNVLRRSVEGNEGAVTRAAEVLVDEGFVVEEKGPRGARLFRSVRPFRRDETRALAAEAVDGRPGGWW